jgi:transposase
MFASQLKKKKKKKKKKKNNRTDILTLKNAALIDHYSLNYVH